MSIFSQIPLPKISRSTHPLNHSFQMTGDFGGIYPIMTELAFAGDSWRCNLEQFVRSMPMIAPVMSMVDIKVDAFFVPIRLIWADFEDFITLGPTGEASFDWPTISIPSGAPSSDGAVEIRNKISGVGGLSDYLNFPSYTYVKNVAPYGKRSFDALPFRCYQFIYNEYFRNQNLESEIPIITSSGNTDLSTTGTSPSYFRHFHMQYRGWNKDYFTSALPYPQKGPAVRMPAQDVVIGADPDSHLEFKSTTSVSVQEDDVVNLKGIVTDVQDQNVKGQALFETENENVAYIDYLAGLKASGVNAPTIEELRYAEVLQEFYEANARGGSRPKEYYLNIWHTRTKDSRLDRPEYLGGYRGPITITDIDQTSQSDISAQATPAGKGISAGGNKIIRYSCSEHGYIMVLVSITPRSSYSQGYRKMNLYRDVFDFPNPFFANLGEQEIKNLELYDDPTDGNNDKTFGYTPRYAEAKFIPSTVHGQLRSNLNYWTLTRLFSSRPNLNSAFVHIDPAEVARIFPSQVSDNDKFVATFYFKIKRRMYLPYWGVPRLIHSL